jgi:hypothetical protein
MHFSAVLSLLLASALVSAAPAPTFTFPDSGSLTSFDCNSGTLAEQEANFCFEDYGSMVMSPDMMAEITNFNPDDFATQSECVAAAVDLELRISAQRGTTSDAPESLDSGYVQRRCLG